MGEEEQPPANEKIPKDLEELSISPTVGGVNCAIMDHHETRAVVAVAKEVVEKEEAKERLRNRKDERGKTPRKSKSSSSKFRKHAHN